MRANQEIQNRSRGKNTLIKSCEESHLKILVDLNRDSSDIKKELKKYLSYDFERCPHCGGITPELTLQLGDLTFNLTPYEIRQFTDDSDMYQKTGQRCRSDNKVILRTNYNKFHRFLELRGKAKEEDETE